jgi:flavodoxin
MKTAIRYYSKFGHSAQMAQVIGEVMGVKPERVGTPLTDEVDILFIGAGVFLGKVNGSIKDFARTLDPQKVKKVVCFGSSAIIDSPVPQLRRIFEELGFNVADDSFTCRGSMGPLHSGHPNAADLQSLREFVNKYHK